MWMCHGWFVLVWLVVWNMFHFCMGNKNPKLTHTFRGGETTTHLPKMLRKWYPAEHDWMTAKYYVNLFTYWPSLFFGPQGIQDWQKIEPWFARHYHFSSSFLACEWKIWSETHVAIAFCVDENLVFVQALALWSSVRWGDPPWRHGEVVKFSLNRGDSTKNTDSTWLKHSLSIPQL